MIMSSSHCLTSISGMNVVTHSETPSNIMLHINFICEPRRVSHSLCNSMQQSYNDPYKFYDGIESWLEGSYMSTCIMNHNAAKFNLLGGHLCELILFILHLSLLHSLQLTFTEHVTTGLELLDWLYWHYAYT
jgi:hypothetical protein